MSAADTKAIGIAIAARAAADQVPSNISSYAKEQLVTAISVLGEAGSEDYIAGYAAARDAAQAIVEAFETETFEFLTYDGWLELMRSKAWKQKGRGSGTRDPFE